MFENESLLWILGTVSVVTFVGTLIAVPVLVARIPTDYFSTPRRHATAWDERHPFLRVTGLVAKNVLGALLIVAGIGMLVLPGQGILTILMGIVLTDFPGKYRLERWLIRRRAVRRAVNWIRRKAGQAAIEAP
jgi:hypothetical protein